MNFNEEAVTFESIIGRQPRSIIFDAKEIASLRDERILVTGAGGSIGSQIIKIIAGIEGVSYLATDRDEGALHSLSLELDSRALFESPQIALLDVRDQIGVNQILSSFKPTLIIHTAALKHLNSLQKQPREATLSNVFGTANLVDAAIIHGIPKFVNISTDKAAEPKSVLGYSKKMAELYVAKARADGHFGYTSCRFGNVFNSRGSVIETFTYQILNEKPITLTHPEIERFFMSMEEAANLTLKSALINLGDVHIFDMGDPVPLAIIIENLQSVLRRFSPVLITGLRDGEKMSEDLFGLTEKSYSTYEPRIKYSNLSIELNKYVKLLNRINSRDEASVNKELSGMTSFTELKNQN
jgi:FlaA1/EpsC-like NDP-sugar epimerase